MQRNVGIGSGKSVSTVIGCIRRGEKLTCGDAAMAIRRYGLVTSACVFLPLYVRMRVTRSRWLPSRLRARTYYRGAIGVPLSVHIAIPVLWVAAWIEVWRLLGMN